MDRSGSNKKKFKGPKQKKMLTNNTEATSSHHTGDCNINDVEPFCPLLAKDSEWVDIQQTTQPRLTPSISDEEADNEDGPETKPIAIMFPGLLERDPQTLQGMLTKAMSTTEVTKHLVDLGEKANFTFMKKANRLIPPEKKWLNSVSEDSNSISSEAAGSISNGCSNYQTSETTTNNKHEERDEQKNL